MKQSAASVFAFACLVASSFCAAQQKPGYGAICSGIPWFDEKGNTVSAHGGCIVKEGERFYFFGEKHSDTGNAFAGFNCYSSTDLYNWKLESIALPLQTAGGLGPNRVGERVKVMKCPATGEFVMYMHADTLGYKDPFVGYATAKTIAGPYAFQGPLLFDGKPVRKWDMGTFQDADGAGYVLIHGGEIYRLGKDYKSLTEQVNKTMTPGFESPAVFRKDSLYYFLGSHLTSWERNDNYYYTAASLKGPWTLRGLFCPEGSLTWNSQTTFVLPVAGTKGTTYLFMGDRWSFPKQASAATYVWQPLTVSGFSISIPDYHEAWTMDATTGGASPATVGGKTIANADKKSITYSGRWQNDTLAAMSSNEKGASFTVKFTGTGIGFYGLARPDGGYARVVLKNSKGKIVLSSMVDMYCNYVVSTLKFLSPVLPEDKYAVTVSVTGERGNWSDKRRAEYGSTGYFVSLEKIVVSE